MQHHIIVGDDGCAGGADALALGLALADAAPDPSAVVVVTAVGRRAGIYGTDERVAQIATEERLRRSRIMCDDRPDVVFRTVVGRDPARALHHVAAELRAEIIVVGRSHHNVVGALVAGSVAEQTLHEAPCAVAIAPPGMSREQVRIRTVRAAYDGGPEARQALAAAAAVARTAGARLSVVHVADRHRLWFSEDLDPILSVDEIVESNPDVRDLGEGLGTGAVRTRLTDGCVRSELADLDDVDLLVVGRRGLGPLAHALTGSTSSHLARRARSAVLVVPGRPTSGYLGEDRQPAAGTGAAERSA